MEVTLQKQATIIRQTISKESFLSPKERFRLSMDKDWYFNEQTTAQQVKGSSKIDSDRKILSKT